VIRKSKGALQVEIARVGANEVVGEMSFFDHQPRSASAFAMTEVQAVEVPYAVLEAAYKTIPPYLRAIISSMSQRLRKADDSIKRLQKSSPTAQGEPSSSTQETTSEELDAAAALAATSDYDGEHSSGLAATGSDEPASDEATAANSDGEKKPE
jgi:CRP-like cAMP-binding protein